MSPSCPKIQPLFAYFSSLIIVAYLPIFLMILPLLTLFVLTTVQDANMFRSSMIPIANHITVGTFKFFVSPMIIALGNILHVGIQISITVDLHLSEIVTNIAASIYTLAVKRGVGDSNSIIFGASQIHGHGAAAPVLVLSILSSGTMTINTAYTCCTVFVVTSDFFNKVEDWSRVFTGGRSCDTDAVVDETTNIGRVTSQCLRCSTLSNITALEVSRGCGAGGALISLFSADWLSDSDMMPTALSTCFSIGQGDVCYSTKVRQLDRVGGRLVVGRNSKEEGGKELHVGFDI
mmetsp:Transcript_31025/g.45655  ORF Transcript_31025/g.45655 Transcript_31025/m.45655 type:complete len:291 (+) Transcript_31025:275-1147(+)